VKIQKYTKGIFILASTTLIFFNSCKDDKDSSIVKSQISVESTNGGEANDISTIVKSQIFWESTNDGEANAISDPDGKILTMETSFKDFIFIDYGSKNDESTEPAETGIFKLKNGLCKKISTANVFNERRSELLTLIKKKFREHVQLEKNKESLERKKCLDNFLSPDYFSNITLNDLKIDFCRGDSISFYINSHLKPYTDECYWFNARRAYFSIKEIDEYFNSDSEKDTKSTKEDSTIDYFLILKNSIIKSGLGNDAIIKTTPSSNSLSINGSDGNGLSYSFPENHEYIKGDLDADGKDEIIIDVFTEGGNTGWSQSYILYGNNPTRFVKLNSYPKNGPKQNDDYYFSPNRITKGHLNGILRVCKRRGVLKGDDDWEEINSYCKLVGGEIRKGVYTVYPVLSIVNENN
jgi:hypothetical protein